MPHGVAGDDTAFHHYRLRGAEAALTVLIIDKWQNTGILRGRLVAVSGAVVSDHWFD
jgi:hypothetical protein